MSENPLLRLLELAHPGRPQADLLAMIEATPDAKPAKATQKAVQRRSSSSMERRRSWAASGRLPPKLAARFTLAETAVLSVIAVEVAGKGACELTVGHIAALAGVCNQTVRNAFRAASDLGLIRVEERRLSAWRNAPNRVTILASEWLSWLRLARKRGGSKSVGPTNTGFRKQETPRSMLTSAKGFRRTEGGAKALLRGERHRRANLP